MKKILSILASFGLVTTAGITVVGCGKKQSPPLFDKTIDLDKTEVQVSVGQTIKVQIKNVKELKEVKVESLLPNIAMPVLDDQSQEICITGISKGEASIVVKAKNANEVQISVLVTNHPKTIELDKTTSQIYVNAHDTIQILNAAQLSEIKVRTWNFQVATAQLSPESQKIMIKGISKGETFIIVTAKDVEQIVIKVKVIIPNLREIVRVTDLGILPNNEKETILAKVIELNKGTENKVGIKDNSITENEAKVVPVTGEYQGEVLVNFTIEENSNDQDVVDAINLSPYFRMILVNTQVDDLNQLIDSNFIKRNILNEEIKKIFKAELFHFNHLLKNESTKLTDEDLKSPILRLETIINYDYGSIKNQNVSLKIEIKESLFPIPKRREMLLEKLKVENCGTPQRKERWETYFIALDEFDFQEILFEFTEKELNNPQLLQEIFYEYLRFIIKGELETCAVQKDYNLATMTMNYKSYDVNQEDKKIVASGSLIFEILQDDQEVPLDNSLTFVASYHLVDFK